MASTNMYIYYTMKYVSSDCQHYCRMWGIFIIGVVEGFRIQPLSLSFYSVPLCQWINIDSFQGIIRVSSIVTWLR
uniref:Uncharacterized protein n=1 Tax=Physcomitrium patens TaxID=3218 RepID=A0A2K1IAF2_PHYPA|nr:hypothetical protein PHYPA_030835 [Physcomitrium patens]